MKMFRRLAAFTIVLSMVLAMLPATVFAGELPQDVKGTKYESAASLLCALDIMVGDGTNFNADKNVTRAEFAKILVTVMGHLDAANAFAATGVFNDVATGQWYAPFVEYATQLGAINGYGNGKFGPNDNVTGYQAIKMICFASGHNACIEDPIAGYPQEYFNVAKEYGFLKNLSDVNFSVAMTRGQVAVLASNVLKADMLRFVSSSSENGSGYEVVEGVNLLNQKHNTYLFEGLVTENDKTGLYGQSTVLPGKVQIEKGAKVEVFSTGGSGIENELGTYVKAYYKDDENAATKTILSYEISNTKNTKINLAYEDIDLTDSNDSVIKYWKDGNTDVKTTKMNIADDSVVIWNGASSSYTSVIDAIKDAEGKLPTFEFLDYDGDEEIDVISIKAYDTYVVNRVDGKVYTITDEIGDWSTGSKRTKKIKIDIEEANSFITITDADGEEYEFSDIAVGDVLSIASSEDGSVMDVKISTDVIEGTISSIGRADGEWVFEIDGEDYNLASTYFDYISDGNKDATIADMKVKIGKEYEFKLDAFGQLAYSDIFATDGIGDFGFITFFAQTDDANANLKVRIFAGGSVDVYDVADIVRIDGEKYKGADAIATAMNAIKATYIPVNDVKGTPGYYGDGVWYGVPVLFELNDDEKITYIDTPVVGADEDKYTLRPVRTQANGNIFSSTYRSSAFGNSRPVASSLSVIQLPPNNTNLKVDSEYSTSKSFSTEDTYYVQLFATDPDSYNATYAIIARGANGSVEGNTKFQDPLAANSDYDAYALGLNDVNAVNGTNGVKIAPLFVVSEVMQAIAGEEEDEETIIITGVEDGKEVSYTVDPEYYATGYIMDIFERGISNVATLSGNRTEVVPVLEGDVIRVARNKTTGYITHIAPVFYMEEKVYATAIVDGEFGTVEEAAYAIDVASVMELDGTQSIMSYLMKNTNNRFNKFQLVMDGDRLGTNTDVTMTETGYEGIFTKLMDLKGYSKIALYDASKAEGEKVSSGELSDIITIEDATAEVNPSILILHNRSGVGYSMVIINL